MSTRSGKRGRGRYVDQGRVACSLSAIGEVDVERCLSCAHLADSNLAEEPRWIRCRAGEPLFALLPWSPGVPAGPVAD
jgi:hypothetical protein